MIVTTALVPGKKAPVLLTDDVVRQMKRGSVVVDLAAEQGGNCSLCVPGQIVRAEGVTIVVAHTSDAALTEPLTMLLSGGLLLAMASAVRRFPV